MTDIFLTLIVSDAHVTLARTIAATLSPGGVGMWTTPCAPTSDGPATHWVSSGWVPPAWQYLIPVQTWTQNEDGVWIHVSSTTGDIHALYTTCIAAGLNINMDQLTELFTAADVTEQEPFVALNRLGLVITTNGAQLL